MDNGKYQEACSILENLGDYKDSKDLIIESKYSALTLIDSGKHEEAYSILIKLEIIWQHNISAWIHNISAWIQV